MKSSCCEILLEKPAIILHGSPSEAAGVAFRGALILDVKKVTKIKSIQLRLEGRAQIIRESGHSDGTNKIILDDTLTLIEPNSTYSLAVGKNAFEFEYRFPGHLPETVVTQFGQITYRLKATIERPHILCDIRIQKPVLVKRFLRSVGADIHDESLHITQVYKSAASVSIQAPKRNYTLGEVVPLHVKVLPLKEKVKVRRVAFRLVQNVSLGEENSKKTQQWREISNQAVSCSEFLFNVRLPKNDIFQPGCSTKYIQTSHEVIVLVGFDINGKIECGYITFNIEITHKRQEDESLPVYTPVEESVAPKLPSYKEITIDTYRTCLIR
ncbi:hypothetical protein K493DRAFT_296643 [Basidiobolus meristosporus CBS 931.73]|uniref:Arrestin C-terminal-like domain-containing protein n=1 Tax=Basidiobolus meristosporus CBS 931.73 TaxID=1314790 RepID=A0A1Y1Z4D7_9FUNG|nr:hypothetical protein K493DRAFT_363543 [Basidiobolus meristosporus CBS 931.73]ORY05109.1 hypothetical protein K493DRAFT_296643 [Basidiobolus meristosporus CBS 931.73]|eukprot:ORX76926.1 hypothetical protein K493DRAFT_363543 [Basidiobolus meristosporus CBS 931.73]